jgi:hypothetical protein
VANGGTSLLTASTLGEASPETARRTWPRWLLLGLAMIAVAVVAVVWSASGARLLLGALGLFLAVRGLVLVRGAQTPEVTTELAARARSVGGATAVVGVAGLLVAVLSGGLASAVLLVAVPLGLLGGAAALLGRDGVGRRAGQALLVWALLVTGLLIVAGVGQGWGRAGEIATVVGALAVAVLGVPVLLGAARLRVVAATPVAAAPGAGCGGCACGAGGCAALG